ncbi:MAG: DUF1638 domain-containing protein [Actinobacteria bacterium]|nr:DUF1638 domain-containing protein [Actinomycetota bacterium]
MQESSGKERKLIACATVAEELRQLGVSEDDLVILEFGLHAEPDRLREQLQSQIDEIEGDADILLGYGLCSYAVVGLVSQSHRLVVPRVDDCIALFLGSKQEHLRRLAEEPGTYYLTKGWVEAADSTISELSRLVERYGEKKAFLVARLMLVNYKRVALINTGNYRMKQYRDFARGMAEIFDLRFEEIPGSNRLLLKMLQAEWDGEFLVIDPGGEVKLSDFMDS